MSHTTLNAFGALSLAVADRMQEAMASVAGHGASGPAALVALDGLAGGASIDALRRLLGITHSGAVRLVDRLAAAGLVERRVGADARAVAIHLTPQGRRTARRVRAAREAALEQVLSPLSPAQREQLKSLLGTMAQGLEPTPETARRLCRLCDVERCGHSRGTCPVSNARLER
ncbi:MAG TPA: MarR family winged helix-turn-helix transcriptional regulator [Solirubrobacteraceae bacterium]|nr:MarR family winged helix-turn-helix transcriptional regulator [Solirubrobacteraceae bacterium]